MDLCPSPRQQELINLAYRLAINNFAPRAAQYDREASFPFADYDDLRAAGLLALCVPQQYGGLGATFETYCLVAEHIAQGNASTALTFNMHCLTMLMMGEIADALPMSDQARARHETRRARMFHEVVTQGVFYGQPHSEPVELGQTDTALTVGGRRFGTTARQLDGGYVLNGHKFFVSLAGAAHYYSTPALLIGDGPWLTIVGIVPNVKNRKLDEDAWPYVYRPYSQWVRRETMLVVRSEMDPTIIAGNIRQEVAKLDPELPLSKVSTIRQAMDRSLATTRLTNWLLAGFAATALLLALTGIYGVMSLNVANRRNEFGIRLALGAQTSNVLKLILGQGLKLAIVCVALGLLAAIAFTRLLKGLLFGISASDPLTFALIAALLVGVALLACWIPARRATKVDPLEALRSE